MSPNEAVKLNQRQLPWVKCKVGGEERGKSRGRDLGWVEKKNKKKNMNFSIKPPESQHEQTQLQEEEAAAELQINKCFWQWRRKNTPHTSPHSVCNFHS